MYAPVLCLLALTDCSVAAVPLVSSPRADLGYATYEGVGTADGVHRFLGMR